MNLAKTDDPEPIGCVVRHPSMHFEFGTDGRVHAALAGFPRRMELTSCNITREGTIVLIVEPLMTSPIIKSNGSALG